MYAEIIIKLLLIAIGVVIFVSTVFSLARRVMTETFCIVWGVLSLMFILAGIVLRPSDWSMYISNSGSIIILIAAICIIWCAFFMTKQLSILNRKNQELAMQISLLNQENEKILEQVASLRKNGDN